MILVHALMEVLVMNYHLVTTVPVLLDSLVKTVTLPLILVILIFVLMEGTVLQNLMIVIHVCVLLALLVIIVTLRLIFASLILVVTAVLVLKTHLMSSLVHVLLVSQGKLVRKLHAVLILAIMEDLVKYWRQARPSIAVVLLGIVGKGVILYAILILVTEETALLYLLVM